MKRREFITLLSYVAALSPIPVWGQQASRPSIGFLSSLSEPVTRSRIRAFIAGLGEVGITIGRDVVIKSRYADGQYDRLPELAADLLSRQVSVIAALAPPAAFAAKAATTKIPIVFVGGFDPVKAGLVSSLSRPGGNVTGITFISSNLGAKRLELALELLSDVRKIALLTNPISPDALQEWQELQDTADNVKQRLVVATAQTAQELDIAFATILIDRPDVLLMGSDPFLFQNSSRLIELALRHRIPTIYNNAEIVSAGGLISYGASILDAWRLCGTYAGRILKGSSPSDLPIIQPVKFELAVNLKTAKALGLTVPPTLLARADEVIE